ncbi:MAG: histidine--tRNA ligase [Candidatus Cloacimonetes bacterium HGW-Cloacimonetes-1]|jgi:histidyl-tRNA synthetase|nr:MAG: histidine--tRNA ligase [Candidatus Cloacimonetes bacterium HGW-Cloacimonetes-1]
MKYKIPRGTFDILPDKSWLWQQLESTFFEVAKVYGYERIVTPIFEMSELFERSSGESSDIVQKEMYRFTDRKDRSFALRPEGTAPVVRSYVENHLDMQAKITKLYYMGPMFRYDRPQAGRYRQFYQYGVELIGSNHPYYDAEVIALQWDFLSRLGLQDIRVEINSVGCADCAKDYDAALRTYYTPHLDAMCPDCQARIETKPRRLLDCKVPACKALGKDAPSQLDFLDEPCHEHFDQVKNYLDVMKVPFVVNPKIVRGLDYYTNTAFEFINDQLGAQNSIAGGGRYNGLFEQIGGKSIPAIGFAGGFERLLLSIEKADLISGGRISPDVYAVALGDDAQAAILPLIATLRGAGLYVEYEPEKTTMKSQLKAADGKSSRFAMILGEDEVATKTVVIKNLLTKEQVTFPSSDTDIIVEHMQ